MSSIPQRFGRYHVLDRIARGGMAEVYRAKAVGIAGFEKILALKRILPDLARVPRFLRAFVDEARIAVSLNHRNIVQVFDFGKDHGELFLAMELVEGVNLRTAIRDAARRGLGLDTSLACYILADIAAGLDYAHQKTDFGGRPLDIVHCDVSPQNVMVSYEGFVKILDFGVARAGFTSAPATRRLRGKPRYMAPEQARGDPPSAASDVFALGILGWELLTGTRLFDGPDVRTILAKVQRADVPPLQQTNPAVPAELGDAVGRALSRRPNERGSAADLAAAFAKAARGFAAGTGAGARDLASWMAEIYPPSPAPADRSQVSDNPPTSPTLIAAPSARGRAPTVADADHTPGTGSGPSADRDLERRHDLAALREKRRVVAAAVVIAGGSARARSELARILADVAYKRGAVVHSRDTDSLVCAFGLEVAAEDDVAAAMTYALDAVELARGGAGEAEGDQPLSVRVAARGGIMARRHERGYRLPADAAAETVALARAAEPNRPQLVGATGRLASAQFVFRELPARRLGSRRLRVLELIGPRSSDERARALRERPGRFFGREAELAALADGLARASREDRRVAIALTGRAGAGKSRLAAEFVARAESSHEPPPLLVAAAATAGARQTPLALFVALVQAAASVRAGHGEAARARLAQRVRRLLSTAGHDRDEVDEVVGALELAMELSGGAADTPARASADVLERITAAFRSLRRALLPPGRPLIIVIEDVHLADGASAEILRSLLRPPHDPGPELLLMTARTEPDAAAVPDTVDTTIEVPELESGDREALIRDRLGDAAAEASIAAVSRRSGGNPLFIEELATAVRQLGPGEIPSTARDVIVARVARLDAPAKATLQHASAIGPVFQPRVLEELLGPDVHRQLQSLTAAGLVTAPDAGPERGEDLLAFRHGLIQEVVYDSLSAPAVRDVHARLGAILAARQRAGRDEPPAVIARHLELGGERARAARFWVRAGQVALAACDPAAAVEAFTRTLTLDADPTANIDTLAGDLEVSLSVDMPHPGRRWDALSGREQAYRMLGDHDAQAEDLAALEALTHGDHGRIAEVKNRTAIRWLRLGDYPLALRAAVTAEQAALSAGDVRGRGESLRIRAEAYERQAEYDRALAAGRRARELFRSIGAEADETRAMLGIGRALLVRAHYEAAKQTYEPILARVRRAGDSWLERMALNHIAIIQMCLGELERAMESATRAVEICRWSGDRAREGDNVSVCGVILLTLGQYDEARETLRAGLAIHEETGSNWSRADCLVYAGTAEVSTGEHGRGIRLIEEGISLARAMRAGYIEANGLVALAGALLRRGGGGDLDAARDAAMLAQRAARTATLVGPEIQGLAAEAEARWRAGDAAAVARSERAMALLDEQHHIEGSEEEIAFLHYRILAASAHLGAGAALARAWQGYSRKLALLTRPEWRRSFQAIPLHLDIRVAAHDAGLPGAG